MSNLKNLLTNCLLVIIAAVIGFFIHLLINNTIIHTIETSQIIFSYAINIAMACGVIIILFLFQRKLKNQLGFIFMGASMVKFIIFFLVFYPEYNADGNLSRLEFFIFFIPYVICLITESIILSKFLNSLDD